MLTSNELDFSRLNDLIAGRLSAEGAARAVAQADAAIPVDVDADAEWLLALRRTVGWKNSSSSSQKPERTVANFLAPIGAWMK